MNTLVKGFLLICLLVCLAVGISTLTDGSLGETYKKETSSKIQWEFTLNRRDSRGSLAMLEEFLIDFHVNNPTIAPEDVQVILGTTKIRLVYYKE